MNAAVAALKESLTALQGNVDGSRSSMLKLNLREAQETLSRYADRPAAAFQACCLASMLGGTCCAPAPFHNSSSLAAAAAALLCARIPQAAGADGPRTPLSR